MASHANLTLKNAGIPGNIVAPVVTSVAPNNAPAAGGDAVTITGRNFSRSSPPAVTFDGVAATGITVVSKTSITCTTPAHAAGAVDVVVTNSNKGDGHSLSGTGVGVFTYT